MPETNKAASIKARRSAGAIAAVAVLLLVAACNNQYPPPPPQPGQPLTWAQQHYIEKMRYQQWTQDRLP